MELSRAAKMPVATDDDVIGAATKVLQAAQAEAILATRSEKGMMLIEASGAVHTESARAREVFDVSGAGDTVIAVLALAHASGQPLPQAMRLANTAAGIVVGKLATAAVELDELILELSREAREDHIGQAKIYSAAVACPLKPGPGLMLGLAVTGNKGIRPVKAALRVVSGRVSTGAKDSVCTGASEWGELK
jgi:D-beta-D-heptose 7-phosphate kinase/D-beta-D-heptose 1-phosphate adenosyltransferase